MPVSTAPSRPWIASSPWSTSDDPPSPHRLGLPPHPDPPLGPWWAHPQGAAGGQPSRRPDPLPLRPVPMTASALIMAAPTPCRIKQCSRCKAIKPIEFFGKRKIARDGRNGRCKACISAYNDRWKKDNSEAYLCSMMLTAARRRARLYNRTCTVDFEYVMSLRATHCPVLGIELNWTYKDPEKSGKLQDNSPSIDRINPLLGYDKGNIAIISWKANRLKSHLTLDEARKLIAWWQNPVSVT